MTKPAELQRQAWQPLTPGGVAAFARAPVVRLLLIQLAIAIVVGLVAAWFLRANWYPVIDEAIERLPAQGEIVTGELNLANESPRVLSSAGFLSLAVDLDHSGEVRSPAQIQVEFGRKNVWILSLFGYFQCAYPKGWIIAFNKTELVPKWGAWRLPLLGVTVVVIGGALLTTWAFLAACCGVVARLCAFYANRDLGLWAAWKLAGAALMPGALLLLLGLGLYTLGAMDLVQLLAVGIAHLAVDFFYLVAGILKTSKLTGIVSARKNPFAAK